MAKKPTAADAQVCMQFYDLRREAEMRKARNWFGMWMPPSFEEYQKIGADFTKQENAWLRMVLSYWENAASLVLRGAVHRELFLDWNHEMVFVYVKIKPFLKQLRQSYNTPEFLQRIEKVMNSSAELRKEVASMEKRLKDWAEKMNAAKAAKA